jgi:hypothetical protein
MAKRKYTARDLSFDFGYNVKPRKPKATKGKKAAKGRRKGNPFGS